MLVQPFILCGGAGSRLWPASRPQLPKPLLPLGPGDMTLLAATLARLEHPQYAPARLICGAGHHAAVSAQKPGVRCIVEPVPRGTAAAVIAAAAVVRHGLVLVLPADHGVTRPQAMHEAVALGVVAAQSGHIVVFGIRPDHAATGYGWIALGEVVQQGCHRVQSFREKPSVAEAQELLDGGEHVWNSGMFLFEASALLAEARRLAPELTAGVEAAVAQGVVGEAELTLAADPLADCPVISFDVAVMERTERGVVVPVDMGWDDVGTWEAVWRLSARDAQGNARHGRVILDGCTNTLAWTDGPQVLASGVSDSAIVASANGVLVIPRSDAQRVGTLSAGFGVAETRPWGSFVVIDRGAAYQVKRLSVDPGHRLSEQRHAHRSELWTVVAGVADVTLEGEVSTLKPGQSVTIPVGATHRLGNSGSTPLVVVEVQTGTYLEEDDIWRGEDDYGRV